jgi:ABC-type dipeptide/oligopeptide/nickel transport system ATPase subunit
LQAIGVSNSYDLPRQHLFGKRPQRKVLDGVDLAIAEGEVFGLVGESGCGKTTLGKALLGLIDHQGQILIDGKTFTRGHRLERARRIQAVFQNPASALNPAKKVGWLLEEPLRIHGWARPRRRERVLEILEQVGLDPSLANRRPNELSGGQKQRIGIGCALVLAPRLIIADEATSALDVSVAAQILNLFGDLHRGLGLSMLFISHNLEVVYYLCDRIAVMFEGRIVEQGTAKRLYEAPGHPYTQVLLAAIPSIRERNDSAGDLGAKETLIKSCHAIWRPFSRLAALSDTSISPASSAVTRLARRENDSPSDVTACNQCFPKAGTAPATACPYVPRCPRQTAVCWERVPELLDQAAAGQPPHLVRCHLAESGDSTFGTPAPTDFR